MDLYFQGLAWYNKGASPDNVGQSRSFFDRALAVDPDNVDALIGSARADVREGANFFVSDPMAAFAAAEAKLTKALSSVPDHARGHVLLGYVDILTKRAAEGIAECERALELDWNLASAHAFIGLGKIFIGRAEETEAHVREALRLSPRDTNAHTWKTFAGTATTFLGSHEQAAAWFRRAIEANRNYPTPYFLLAAALAKLGRLDEAHSAVEAGLALNPTLRHRPRPRRLDGEERRPDVSGPTRACSRRPAQGRSPRTMTETRKLAAIMAVDVVGYSRLMGEDEAGTARAVRERREAARPIVAGGGRIVKTMGDGLLLEFPSVVAAVECAIAIQRLMVERNAETPEGQTIVYRIGVNLGDVLIEGDDIGWRRRTTSPRQSRASANPAAC